MQKLVLSVPSVVIAGCMLVVIKVVYSFFPLFNLVDIAVFGFTGLAIGYLRAQASIILALVAALPATVLCLYFVGRLGFTNVAEGVGTGWLISLFIIPLSAVAGVRIGAYFSTPKRGSIA